MTSCTKIGIPSVSLTQTLCVNKPLGRTETPLGWPRHRRCLGFNWWEDICYILLKKISSSNAFYVFLPLFKHQTSAYKHQTSAYNVLFLQKNMPFFSLLKQEQEVSGRGLTTTTKPHVHAVCNPDSLHTVF